MSAPATTAARKATARAAGAQRTLVGLIGLLGLAAGAAALVVGFGLLGANRAVRPVLDPIALDTLRTYEPLARAVALVAGIVLLVLGLLWAARALVPERRPNLLLDPSPDRRLEVSASAIADALRADAETIDGVTRARARMVGTTAIPVLRLDLWLEDGTDVRDVYHNLDTGVLTRARDSLGVESLPTAIRIELDAAAPARVT
ncbi:MAG TPA: alkaline shock response membrane anchor protein AmaP [Pseudonocardiaceae bacterium]|nr:alkaline shock response membrane anchor protein AmaP [Pseudonocardiaceae bacterium]